MLADGPNLGDFLLNNVLLPFLGALVVFALLGKSAQFVGPRIARAWRGSRVRRWFRAISKAWLCLIAGVMGNGLAVLLCAPLLLVPVGSGVKPMSLPLLFILVAAFTIGVCRQATLDAERPRGSRWLHEMGCLLSLTPFFVGLFAMHAFAAMRDLTFG